MPKAKNPKISIMADRVRRIVDAQGSIASAARFSGLSVNTISRLYNGAGEPGVYAATAFAKAFKVPLDYVLGLTDDLKPRAEELPPSDNFQQDNVVNIPVLDVRAAAGAGAYADVVKATGSLPFATEFLRKLVPSTDRLSCLRCSGHSMSPTIADGAILIVDELQNTLPAWKPVPRKSARQKPKQDGIYVFIQGGDVRLKRLRDVGEEMVAIISDNGDENPIEIFKRGRDGSLAIIGKVVWWDNRL